MSKYVVVIRRVYERARFVFDDKYQALEFLAMASETYVGEKDETFNDQDVEFLYFKEEVEK